MFLSQLRQILKANFHAYHILQQVQALIENQKQKRIEFYHWGLKKLKKDPTFFDKILFTTNQHFRILKN